MGEEITSLGRIFISPRAIATIAQRATLQSYGVVGLAPRGLAEGLSTALTHHPARGVYVRYEGEKLEIEVHIIVEYGTRIASVTQSVANAVRFQVEKTTGLPVDSIHVHVASLRISNGA